MVHVGRVTATSGGTAGDIRAAQVLLTGEDHNGTTITETLPIFTVNSATTVTGDKIFRKLTSIQIPAHDGTGATTSIGIAGEPAAADTNGVAAARTDTGATVTVTTGTSINGLSVPKNITATSGGTAGDIRAAQVVIAGKNELGNTITETLPIFTVNSATTVTGALIFKEVTSIQYPAMDGTAATVAIGYGEILALGKILKRNTVRNAYLDNTVEATAPTVVVDDDELEKNSADLNSSLNNTPVIIEYMETPE